MKTLLVSQYYAPEVGATQNRMTSFVQGLARHGHDMTVVCEQPNHPAGVFQPGYGRRPLVSRDEEGARVHRLWVATSPRKTTSTRLAFYGTFAAGALGTVSSLPRPDVVLASSPPLPGALAAAVAARVRRIPFVLDVRDLWPAAAEALGELSNPALIARLERAERWLYRHARAVTATTLPFCRHIDAVAGRAVSVHLPNGALDELLALELPEPAERQPLVIGYIGNLGIAQGLGIVLDAAERLRGEPVRFLVVGDGPLSEQLRSEAAERDLLGSVDFRPVVPTARLPEVLELCHALLVPLRAHSLLEDFIPSKLYDAMAVGRPAVVAAGGEAASLVAETGCGMVVAPEDGEALAGAARRLLADPAARRAMGAAGRRAAAPYARSRQIEKLDRLLRLAAAA